MELARLAGFSEIAEFLTGFIASRVSDVGIAVDTGEEAAATTDVGGWEAEGGPTEPAGDPEFLTRATLPETKIAGFEYLNPDEDWADVEADLPEYQLFAGIRKAEFHTLRAELVSFFGAAIASGTVSHDELLDLGSETAEIDDEGVECIVRVLEELGVEVVEGVDAEVLKSWSDEISEEGLEIAEDATAYFGDLWSPSLDCYTSLLRDIGRSKLLSAEDEIFLAEALENSGS